MKTKKHRTLGEIISDMQHAMMRGERLAIKGRDDLMTATRRLEYDIPTRTGKLYLAAHCTVNYRGCVRLFMDIDPEACCIHVFSGDMLDGIYRRNIRKEDGWELFGFPF